jgi:hypothetical protein
MSGPHVVEVVHAVGIGDRGAAVLEHDAHAADAGVAGLLRHAAGIADGVHLAEHDRLVRERAGRTRTLAAAVFDPTGTEPPAPMPDATAELRPPPSSAPAPTTARYVMRAVEPTINAPAGNVSAGPGEPAGSAIATPFARAEPGT